MPRATWVQTNFNGGEWSPLAYGRFDLPKYKNGLALCKNWLPTQQGGLTRRPGTRFVAYAKSNANAVRLLAFEFSIAQAYILEFGDYYVRFYFNDGQMQNSGVPYEVATPYSATDIWSLNFAQSADTLYIAHPKYAPRKLQRVQATPTHIWTLTQITFLDGPYLPINVTGTTLAPNVFGSSGGTATFSGFSMTLTGVPTLGAVAIGQIVTYGAYTGTIMSLASGVLNQVSSVYNMSAAYTYASPYPFTSTFNMAGGSTVPVVASSIVGINGGAGFRASDMGRALRIKAGGVWVWGTIASVVDTLNITWTTASTTGSQAPSTAKAIANISGGSVFSISVTDGGTGYGVKPPAVTITGGAGSGAIAYASLTNGVVTAVTVSVTGSGYTSAPTVTLDAPTALVPSTSTFWRLGLWNSTDGYPNCVTFHQDRLCWAGPANTPNRIDCSNSGDYENQAPTELDGTVTDASAIGVSLNAGVVNAIAWIKSDQWGLLVGTAGSEWVVSPSSVQQALTPTNINAMEMSNYGSASGIQPIRAGRSTLFIQRTGRKIRELIYQFMLQTFQAMDISLVSEHLTTGGIKQLGFQLTPQQIVWMARNDGTLIGMTYDKDQDICGWHWHSLGGFSDAASSVDPVVESVAAIPAPGIQRDEVWVSVQRYINGTTVRTIEVMSKLWEDGDTLPHCNFLDCSRESTGSARTTITGYTWLAGQTVSVLTDGSEHPDRVVAADGSFSLNWAASVVQAGLGYTSSGQTLSIEAGGQDGPAQGKLKRVFKTMLRFFQSVGLSMGTDETGGTFYPEPFRTPLDDMDSPIPLQSGDQVWPYEGTWDTEGRVSFQATGPLPANITLLMAQLDTEDAQ